MDRSIDNVSRRTALGVLSGALTVGLSGCTGLQADEQTATATSTPTQTATATPTQTAPLDPPNIERQTVLRDKAAISHIRRTVSGTIEWPAAETYDRVDTALLGRWDLDSRAIRFSDDRTITFIGTESRETGTYSTVPQQGYLRIEYDGSVSEYSYQVDTGRSTATLSLYDTEGSFLGRYERTVDGRDGRTATEYAEDLVFYEPEGAQTNSQDLTTGSAGSGFIVNPDGYLVTNAHVVGAHEDPDQRLYRQLAREDERELRQAFESSDLSEGETEAVVDILLDKASAYYAEKSSARSVSTDIGVLSGTAAPDETFSAESWPATIETTGSVYDEVNGETTWGRDIAVLKVDVQHQLPTVRLGESSGLGSGAEVFVIGYPDIGLQQLFEDRNTSLEPSLTSGVVSARRTLRSGVETIQTDAAINNGNSGGPVYNSDGNVVGVATFAPSDAGIEDTGFALPIETATGFMGELGVENEQSELSTTYQEGLNALWRDDCETVDEKMNAVLDVWPDHPYAEDIKEQC